MPAWRVEKTLRLWRLPPLWPLESSPCGPGVRCGWRVPVPGPLTRRLSSLMSMTSMEEEAFSSLWFSKQGLNSVGGYSRILGAPQLSDYFAKTHTAVRARTHPSPPTHTHPRTESLDLQLKPHLWVCQAGLTRVWMGEGVRIHDCGQGGWGRGWRSGPRRGKTHG